VFWGSDSFLILIFTVMDCGRELGIGKILYATDRLNMNQEAPFDLLLVRSLNQTWLPSGPDRRRSPLACY